MNEILERTVHRLHTANQTLEHAKTRWARDYWTLVRNKLQQKVKQQAHQMDSGHTL